MGISLRRLSFYSTLGIPPYHAPPGDVRVQLRCVTTNDAAFLHDTEADTADEAVDIVNDILSGTRAPRWSTADEQWTPGSLTKAEENKWTQLVRISNLVPLPPRGGRFKFASYERLGPDDAAAAVGHCLDGAGRSPTAWLRDLEQRGVPLPPGSARTARDEELRIIGQSYSPLMLLANLPELFAPATPGALAALANGPPRPLWSLCCGMGSELHALAASRAPLSKIYAVDDSAAPLATYARVAHAKYPDADLFLYGDFLDPATKDRWSEEAILARLNADKAVPLIFSGWPCLGHAGSRRQGHDDGGCYEHPSSAMLLVVARIVDTVVRWLATQ